jgi:hypothetical protein
MNTRAERAKFRLDAKAKELVRWLHENIWPGGKWSNQRVIIFTRWPPAEFHCTACHREATGSRHPSSPRRFSPWWETLPALAQVRVVQRLVERVDYDGVQGTVAITFVADAAQAVAEQQAPRREEINA